MRVRTGRLHAPGGFTRRRLAVPLPPLWRAQPWSLWIEAQAAASQATRPIEASHARAHGPCRIHAPLVSHSPAAAQRAHLAADLSAHASGHALSMYSAFLSHLRLSPAHARLELPTSARLELKRPRVAAGLITIARQRQRGVGIRAAAQARAVQTTDSVCGAASHSTDRGGGSKHSFQSQALLQFDRMYYSWFAAHSPLAAQAAQSDSDGVASGTARVNNILGGCVRGGVRQAALRRAPAVVRHRAGVHPLRAGQETRSIGPRRDISGPQGPYVILLHRHRERLWPPGGGGALQGVPLRRHQHLGHQRRGDAGPVGVPGT